jgi:hypothetical protein
MGDCTSGFCRVRLLGMAVGLVAAMFLVTGCVSHRDVGLVEYQTPTWDQVVFGRVPVPVIDILLSGGRATLRPAGDSQWTNLVHESDFSTGQHPNRDGLLWIYHWHTLSSGRWIDSPFPALFLEIRPSEFCLSYNRFREQTERNKTGKSPAWQGGYTIGLLIAPSRGSYDNGEVIGSWVRHCDTMEIVACKVFRMSSDLLKRHTDNEDSPLSYMIRWGGGGGGYWTRPIVPAGYEAWRPTIEAAMAKAAKGTPGNE